MSLLLRIWNAFWPFEDCYLLGFVLAQIFYCLKLTCMKIYKHAFLKIKHSCFTETWVPCMLLLIDSSSLVPVHKDCDSSVFNFHK